MTALISILSGKYKRFTFVHLVVFSMHKITEMKSNYHLSLYTKLMTVLYKEDWQSMKLKI